MALVGCGGDEGRASGGFTGIVGTSTGAASEVASTTEPATGGSSTQTQGGSSGALPTTGATDGTGAETSSTGEVGSTGDVGGLCGDEVVDVGEECDTGAHNGELGCKLDCTLNVCGDGYLGPGEGCDDGNQVDDDMCSNSCALTSCGDGVVAPTEQCDDGNQNNDDACTAACTNATCGDGFVQAGEGCDAGGANSDHDACTLACQPNMCGDGMVQDANGGPEACDDGANNGPGQTCNAKCALNVCGDGDNSPAEQCDDGNMMSGDGCTAGCKLEACGNMEVDVGEACDDGANSNNDDGCTEVCKKPVCGDGFVQMTLGEKCDLGGLNSNSGTCTLACKPAICGDGLIQAGVEQCDDGNLVDYDACTTQCKTGLMLRANVLQCGASTIDIRKFFPGGMSQFAVVNSCTPDANTQAMLVTNDPLVQTIDAVTLQNYLGGGGVVVTGDLMSQYVFIKTFGVQVTQGAGFGGCSASAPTVMKFTGVDPFWTANAFMAPFYPPGGCGTTVNAFPGITPLAGWEPGAVALAYRQKGMGRLWLADWNWSSPTDSDPYTKQLMGYLITHRN
jgi:cysteine-rich repeat protein